MSCHGVSGWVACYKPVPSIPSALFKPYVKTQTIHFFYKILTNSCSLKWSPNVLHSDILVTWYCLMYSICRRIPTARIILSCHSPTWSIHKVLWVGMKVENNPGYKLFLQRLKWNLWTVLHGPLVDIEVLSMWIHNWNFCLFVDSLFGMPYMTPSYSPPWKAVRQPATDIGADDSESVR